jgi:pimeloyl-ACP methyl ester carboxylesterase
MRMQTIAPDTAASDRTTAVLPPDLPDPLVRNGGARVTSPDVWHRQRRAEILELFRKHVYGRAPVERLPAGAMTVKDVQTPGMMGGTATRHQVALTIAGPNGKRTMNVLAFVPAKAARPSPAFVLICNRPASNIDPERGTKSPFWPAETLVARGYAAVAFQVDDVDPDRPDGYPKGIRAAFDQRRGGDSWGAIGAWAWGASRAMDWLQSVRAIDSRRVAVIGHSRGGKASLWCGAQDERFALAVSNDSGCTGAALARGKTGERIAQINKAFPHWFCENYKGYGDREDELPVDQHELLALIAPRLVYVASATQDAWADPRSEFLSCVAAEPVYRLLGKKGVGADRQPPPEKPLQTGSIGYHLRTGKHDLTAYDWDGYLDFADRHLP